MSAIGARQALLLRAARRRIVVVLPVDVRVVAGGDWASGVAQDLRVGGRPPSDLVALAAVRLHEEPGPVVAHLVRALLVDVPVDLGLVLDGDRRLWCEVN